MSAWLLLATERGLWRAPWRDDLPPSLDRFHVDAPGEAVVALAGDGRGADALLEDGTLLRWDPGAAAFALGPRLDPGEAAISALARSSSGALRAGACPPSVWGLEPGATAWRADAPLDDGPGAEDWTGLETPYEPRVSSLLHRDGTWWAAVSVGGLLRREASSWSLQESPRDLRALVADPFAAEGLWSGGGRGLHRHGRGGAPRRASLPPQASFVAGLARGATGLAAAAAPGPPATWYGPEGARMSLWHFADAGGVGRPVAGPLHGAVRGLALEGGAVLAVTDDGELWRAPLAGPAPQEPLLAELPPVRGLLLVDAEAARD